MTDMIDGYTAQKIKDFWMAQDQHATKHDIWVLFAEIESLKATSAQKDAVIVELQSALSDLREACKAEPAMNNMKYDGLGIKVNKALHSAKSLLVPTTKGEE